MRTLPLLALSAAVLAFACSSEEDEPAPPTAPTTTATTTTTGAGAGGATTTTTTTSSAGGGGGGAIPGCFDYEGFTPTENVSFTNDVMPIFAANCASNNCHGSETNPDAGLYLGSQTGNDAGTIAAVYAELVGVSAGQAPTMLRVAAADAENSYLMIKLDDDMTCPQVTCGSNGCGDPMPEGINATPLGAADLDTIRSWIENGALEN